MIAELRNELHTVLDSRGSAGGGGGVGGGGGGEDSRGDGRSASAASAPFYDRPSGAPPSEAPSGRSHASSFVGFGRRLEGSGGATPMFPGAEVGLCTLNQVDP